MIAPGVILIRNDARLPATLIGGMSPFGRRWSFLTDNSHRKVVETRLALSGWTSSCMSGAIRRASTGVDEQKMIKTALERVLAAASLKSCNYLEIGEIKMHSFLTIRYASVSGQARQFQAGNSSVSVSGRAEEKVMNKTDIEQSGTVFLEGDNVVLARGTYQGTPGIFLRLRADPRWADITERDGIVRSHPLEWLAHASLAIRK